jgi:hypothetical protein
VRRLLLLLTAASCNQLVEFREAALPPAPVLKPGLEVCSSACDGGCFVSPLDGGAFCGRGCEGLVCPAGSRCLCTPSLPGACSCALPIVYQ